MEQEIAVIEVSELSEQDIQQLEEAVQEMETEKQKQLDQFSETISRYRNEAIEGRRISGIEEIWQEDEDFYAGVDDANRDEEQGHKETNITLEKAFTTTQTKRQVKSTVFLNITRAYVDAASARTGDMLLPNDDRNWAYKLTPVSDAVQQAIDGQMGDQIKEMVKDLRHKAEAKLKETGKQVDDWLAECNYTREVRKVIEDCARVGVGVLKGPFPEKRTTNDGYEIKPASKFVKYINFYPDASCGENIQDGRYVFEKDYISAKRLKELKDLPDYLADQIDIVLKEGPDKRLVEDNNELPLDDSELFEIWYFVGSINIDDLSACSCDVSQEGETIQAMVTMINDTVIHANQMPTDHDEYPYDVIPWQRRQGYWAGIGVSRQIRTPQRMLVAASRNMMDNAGISAGPQIVYRKGVIQPEDGVWELTPNKRWFAEDDVDVQSVANAFIVIDIPSLQAPLSEIIQFALKMAEDVTGLPMLMQGSQGTAPDTVGGMTMLNNNANTVLRRIARNFDDYITIPHVKRYYEWQIMYHGSPDDYQIEARGSSSLVERDIQQQAIIQMGAMVLNPAFGVKPDLWMQEYLRSMKFDPKRFQGEDEEDEQDAEKQQMAQQLQQMAMELKTRQGEKKAELNYKYAELNQEREIELMKLAQANNLKLSELKAQLGLKQIEMQKQELTNQDKKVLTAIDSKIKVHEAQTHRLRETTKANELAYKARTGNQGI